MTAGVTMEKKIVKVGTSRGIVLPAWWVKECDKVKLRISDDKIIIEKIQREE